MPTALAPDRKSRSRENAVARAGESARAPFDFYEWMFHPSSFRALPCVLGILIGFVACAIAGAVVSRTNFYHDFHRFHEYISPSTLYYPTVSQMVAIVESKAKPDQTIVIVGGNSIFNGVGQRVPELWSDVLCTDLGNEYAVFNFASPASLSFEGAYWTAESLLAKGRKVIYVTVAMPTLAGAPEGGKVYGYLYWDAHEKRMLARSRERDILIEKRLATDEREKARIFDLRLRMQLDNLLHFQDLWMAVGYSQFFTVWTDLTASNPFKPRRKYGDLQPYPLPTEKRFGNARELEVVRGFCDGFFDITPNEWHPRTDAWTHLFGEMTGLIPNQFKKNCLIMIAGNPPYYLNRISEAERARIRTATAMSQSGWTAAGYHCTAIGEQFSNDDYQDCWHLVGVGGRRLAKVVSAQVLSISQQLGYQKAPRQQSHAPNEAPVAMQPQAQKLYFKISGGQRQR